MSIDGIGKETSELSNKQELLTHFDAIKTLSTLLNSLLEQANENVKESLENFVGDKIRLLGAAMGAYFRCLIAFHVTTKAELESKLKICYGIKELRQIVDNLLKVEEDWDDFLRGVDGMLDNGASTGDLQVGLPAPVDVPLVNIDTGSSTTLGDFIGSNNLLLVLLRHFA